MVSGFYFEFGQPVFFNLAVKLAVIVFIVSALALWRRYVWLKKFSDLSQKKMGRLRFKKLWLALLLDLLLIFGFAFLLMQPVLVRQTKVPEKETVDISAWGDVSLSSLARDIIQKTDSGDKLISRLEYQKMEVLNLIRRLDGDFVSLGVFSGRAYVLVPPMIINEATRETALVSIKGELDKFNYMTIKLLPQGTNLGAAIYKGSQSFRQLLLSEKLPKRILIIFTDGELKGDQSILSQDMVSALRSFQDTANLALYIVGIGNPFHPPEGSFIPVDDPEGIMKIEVDQNNMPIRTKPDFRFLKQVADRLDGKFLVAKGEKELSDALDQILLAEREIIGEKVKIKRNKETFRWVALFLLALLLIRNPFKDPLD